MRYFTPISIFCSPSSATSWLTGNNLNCQPTLPRVRLRRLGELRANANKGDAFSQWNMGFMFAKGQSVPKSEVEAAKSKRLSGFVKRQIKDTHPLSTIWGCSI
jgi:hypothetical protein